MVLDISKHIEYIKEKIVSNNLDTHAFYFYIVPFNEAEVDKKEIMETVLKGDVVI